MFTNKTILITGGTGSFGHAFTRRLLDMNPRKVIIYSRDEFKQYHMEREFADNRLRFFIGDVKDRDRLLQAMRGVDYVVHAAALKHVPVCEYNPFEAVKTNIVGAMNVVDAAIMSGVKKLVALSTDKSVQPLNLYGATKLCSDKIFIAGNNLSNAQGRTAMAVVRYGNVACSRGSVIPLFNQCVRDGACTLPVTDERMTRFYIDLGRAVDLVMTAFERAAGGETYIAKIPSFQIIDLVAAFGCQAEIIGIRPGEKLHEIMITTDDAPRTYETSEYYVIYPDFHAWSEGFEHDGVPVESGFSYSSDRNTMLSIDELRLLCGIQHI